MRKILRILDKIEDKTRAILSRQPIIYAIIGGIGIVLFWRGVWQTADKIPFLSGPVSIIISISILLVTGLFVSFFIGHSIILSGIKQEKKIEERTESEIETEMDVLKKELGVLKDIQLQLERIENELKKTKKSKK